MALSESMMLVVLGFVLGLIVVLLLARLAWALALRAAARRQADSIPATILDLKAERDRLRAEHAMMAQKLDSRLEESRLRMGEHMAEVTRSRNRVELVAQDLAERETTLAAREAELKTLRADLAAREADIKSQALVIEQLTSQTQAKDQELATRAAEIARLTRFQASLQASLGAGGDAALPADAGESPENRIHRRIAELTSLSREIHHDRTLEPGLAPGATWVKEAGAEGPHFTAEDVFGQPVANDEAAPAANPFDLADIPQPEAKPQSALPGEAPHHDRQALARRIRSLQGTSKG